MKFITIDRKKGKALRMTEGSEIKNILMFMLPLLIGNIFQQLYNFVDSVVVGRFVSAQALGSVGSVGSVTSLFLALCIGLAGGVNVLTAQYFGSENEEGVKQAIANSIYVTAGAGILMSVISVCFAPMILNWMHVPEENFADALIYMRIVCGSMLITAFYNTVSQILRGLGDAATPLYYVIVASVINVVLDLIFVAIFHWGVAGAAWATVIAQFFATVGSIATAWRKIPQFRLGREHMKIQKKIIKYICRMGIPLAVQNAMNSFAGVIMQSVVNSFGSVIMTAYTASGRVEQLVNQPYGSLGGAVAIFSGQNVGAGKFDRIRRGCRKCVWLVAGFSALMLIVMVVFGHLLIGLFVEEPEIIEIGARGLQITAVSYFFSGLVYTYKAMLNGAGDAEFSLGNGVIEIIARILFILILSSIPAVGYWSVWITAIFSSMLAASLCIWRYRSGKWMRKSAI